MQPVSIIDNYPASGTPSSAMKGTGKLPMPRVDWSPRLDSLILGFIQLYKILGDLEKRLTGAKSGVYGRVKISEDDEAARHVEELRKCFYTLETNVGQFEDGLREFEKFVNGLGPRYGPGSAAEEFTKWNSKKDD